MALAFHPMNVRLILFTLIVVFGYVCCALWLVREFRSTPKEDRKQLQTFPLLLSTATFCTVLIWKAHQLAAGFMLM